MRTVHTLSDFYELMHDLREIRSRISRAFLDGEAPSSRDRGSLDAVRAALEGLPREAGEVRLETGSGESVLLDPDYEMGELVKDEVFLTRGEDELLVHLAEEVYEGGRERFFGQVGQGCEFLGDGEFRNFITDRDGTVNNYCGRYRSSIQAIYNAVFLIRFALGRARNSVILTSAPLRDGGLLDVNVSPDGIFHYAGSKGREYRAKSGREGRFPLSAEETRKMEELNERLRSLVSEPGNRIFALIGSGLQFKFGQTTLARQDIRGSISAGRSDALLTRVRALVEETDPEGRYFRIEDTGKDIEIMLTVAGDGQAGEHGGLRDFDKGDGVEFLDRELGLELSRGSNLVCGDTSSDLAMVRTLVERSGETYAVFVTKDENLREAVRSICTRSFFVDSPDILVTILNRTGVST